MNEELDAVYMEAPDSNAWSDEDSGDEVRKISSQVVIFKQKRHVFSQVESESALRAWSIHLNLKKKHQIIVYIHI